jgi:hypothetical protein
MSLTMARSILADRRAQRLQAVHDEQPFLLRAQVALDQAREQVLSRRGVLGVAALQAQHVLAPGPVPTHRRDHRLLAEAPVPINNERSFPRSAFG